MEKSRFNSISTSLSPYRKYFRRLTISVTVVLVIYLVLDYRGPKYINLNPDNVFGFPCLRAKDLIVQEYDQFDNLWATRGMIIYQLKKNSGRFTKVAHVPTGPSIFWLRNFSFIRRYTVRPECMEIVSSASGEICALSAGKIWYRPAGGKSFYKSIKLSHYGFGDQGIRNDGIVRTNDSTIFFGEYFRNPGRTRVRIYKSHNNGRSWIIAYEYQPGQIRHIHALQTDPYSDKKWICTGDRDNEASVGWTVNDYKTIQPIGYGSQIWRICQLVFTKEAVYWGADTGDEELSGIYRWDRENKQTKKLIKVDGAIFFGTSLAKGTIVMSTDRENMGNEKDHRTRLFILTSDNSIKQIDCGTWDHFKPGFRYKFALLRFQRNQGGPSLAVSCLNQKELPDGDLIIISEEELQKRAKSIGLSP